MLKHMQNVAVKFWEDEEGIGMLEIILIIAVIVLIAIVFRKWIIAWIQKLMDSSNEELKKTETDTLIVPDVP